MVSAPVRVCLVADVLPLTHDVSLYLTALNSSSRSEQPTATRGLSSGGQYIDNHSVGIKHMLSLSTISENGRSRR